MKKTRNLSNKSSLIKLVSLILLSTLLLVCLSGCDLLERFNILAPDEPQDNGGVKAPNENTDTKAPNENTENKDTVSVPDGVDADLIYALIDHLNNLMVEYDLLADDLNTKINKIIAGSQPLLLDFAASDYYYICGYYNCSEHDYESIDYPCAEKYTWVKYDAAEDIRDYSGELALVVSFQINKASLAECVIPGDTAPINVEHFLMYTPTFEDGVNKADAYEYGDSFLYLNSSEKNSLYFSTFVGYNSVVSRKCVKVDGEYYITQLARYSNAGGEVNEEDLAALFGKYYDGLMAIISDKEYSITNENGNTSIYALIAVDDFGSYLATLLN